MSVEEPSEGGKKKCPPRPAPRTPLAEQGALEFADAPVVIAGPPPKCVGYIVARNTLTHDVRVRGLVAQTEAEELRVCVTPTSPKEQPAEQTHVNVALHASGRICAGESQELRLALSIPPHLAPGTFTAVLKGSGRSARKVLIQVLEHRKTRFTPKAVSVAVVPGEKLSVNVSATNTGNIPTTIPRGVPARMHVSDRGWPHHFHAAALHQGQDGYQKFLDDFVKRFAEDEPPVARIKIKKGYGELPPGETRLLELEMTVPESLHIDRDYLTLARLGEGRFRFRLRTQAGDSIPPVE